MKEEKINSSSTHTHTRMLLAVSIYVLWYTSDYHTISIERFVWAEYIFPQLISQSGIFDKFTIQAKLHHKTKTIRYRPRWILPNYTSVYDLSVYMCVRVCRSIRGCKMVKSEWYEMWGSNGCFSGYEPQNTILLYIKTIHQNQSECTTDITGLTRLVCFAYNAMPLRYTPFGGMYQIQIPRIFVIFV